MPTYWTSGRVLLRELLIEADMVNLSPLRVGAGQEAPLGSIVDLAVIRITRGGVQQAYVPGSSLKGLSRTQAEVLLWQKNPRNKPCSGLTKETCMDIKETEDGRRLRDAVEDEIRGNRSESAMELFFRYACLLCKIFGAPSYSGRIVFADAYLTGEARYGVRTGIAIDRRTGAVHRHQLYQVEYIEPGARFRLGIGARNLPNYAVGLITKILEMLKVGEIRVGGFKTRGFGVVTLENPLIKYRDYRQPSANLDSLEENVDREIRLEDLATVEDGWYVIKGGRAWEGLRRFVQVWEGVNLS